MSSSHRITGLALCALAVSAPLAPSRAAAAPTLDGWAIMPAQTTSPGPTSGQFAITPSSAPYVPLVDAQPVQGFSAVLSGPRPGTLRVMPDNGFGAKENSGDTLLRVYALRPDFRVWNGRAVVGAGKVTPVSLKNGRERGSFDGHTHLNLRDPDQKLGFKIQADYCNYYDLATNPAVDEEIRDGRLLTGADFDIEAVREDRHGNLWFGEEFGPFLVKTDRSGKVLRKEIPLPNFKPAGSTATGEFVRSPQNPYLNGETPNLGRSLGFEGMALNASRTKLYPLLEGTVVGDPARTLRIAEFDLAKEKYVPRTRLYPLNELGTNIGDMTAVNDHEFLVIERNGNTATTAGAPFKRIYLIDIDRVDANGLVKKTELVDLMNVADPRDLNGDGSALFTFPYVTIESVLILDARTLIVLNDNNFPGGGGRSAAPDATEVLRIKLDRPLNLKRDADECDEQSDD